MAVVLAGLLAKLIKVNNPKAKAPTGRAWSDAIDKIHRLDGYAWDEIEAVIRWSQADQFWHKNILSGPKLRKQMDRLVLEMKDGGPKKTSGNLDTMNRMLGGGTT